MNKTQLSQEDGESRMDDLPVEEAAESNSVILIAIDASSQAQNAFEYYVANLHSDNNDLLLVHIAEPPALTLGQSADKRAWDEKIDEEQDRVKALEDKYGLLMSNKSLNGRIVAVFSNKPGETICKIAARENCSLVVMGTRGLGVVRRTLLGSVSDFVLHHAHCPVCICRPAL